MFTSVFGRDLLSRETTAIVEITFIFRVAEIEWNTIFAIFTGANLLACHFNGRRINMLHKRIHANEYVEQFLNDRSHSKHNINLQDNVNAEK